LPALAAALAESRFTSEPLIRRAINANLRVGTAEAAQRVAAYAASNAARDSLRSEAIAALGVWPAPSILDRVDGVHIGVMQRDTTIARAALAAIMEPIFASASPQVQIAMAGAVARLRMTAAVPT